MNNFFRKILASFQIYLRKRRAFFDYIQKLPQILVTDYSSSVFYTPEQIRSSIERSGLDMYYSCYAVAIFSNRENFDRFHESINENCDYDTMRSEIYHRFYGNTGRFSDNDGLPFAFHFPESGFGGHHSSGADGHGDGGHHAN